MSLSLSDRQLRIKEFFARQERERTEHISLVPHTITRTTDRTVAALPGDVVDCPECQHEYILAADDAQSPEDGPAAEALHSVIPSCPSCLAALAAVFGLSEPDDTSELN